MDSCVVVSVDSRLLRSDRERDCERSERGSGREVISDASSKLSCNGAPALAWAFGSVLIVFGLDGRITHSFLVGAVCAFRPLGLLVLLHIARIARRGWLSDAKSRRESQSVQSVQQSWGRRNVLQNSDYSVVRSRYTTLAVGVTGVGCCGSEWSGDAGIDYARWVLSTGP